MIGSLIEEVTSERARRHIERLGAASPDHALVIDDDGETREVEATSLAPGQLILVRPGDVVAADGVVEQLRRDGFGRLLVLTGDLPPVAARVAEALGIASADVRAGQLPEQKYEALRELEVGGQRVCYVGDGTNDGPALAVASVGVSIGSRENTVALETADAVLMRGGLAQLPLLLQLGRRTARTINQNLILFGLLLNATLLTLSAAGVLTPILGALAHNAGSVAVVLNSARLLRQP